MNMILLAIDGSDHSERAARVVGEVVWGSQRCIVMGRRGLGDLGGILMGSVSHKVGHLSPRTLVTTE